MCAILHSVFSFLALVLENALNNERLTDAVFQVKTHFANVHANASKFVLKLVWYLRRLLRIVQYKSSPDKVVNVYN
jgi:hypothetical protein